MEAYLALAAAQMATGFQQAQMIRKSAEVKASIDEMNARYAEIDSYNAGIAGVSAGARQESNTSQVVAKQRAAMAGANVGVDYGTAQDIQGDSKVTGMLNVLELQRQGREKALGYKVQAINTRLGAQMSTLQAGMDAGAAQTRGIMNAASTGLSGYDRMQSTGKGIASKSGDNATPTYGGPQNTVTAKGQPSWYFGDSPRPYAQPVLGGEYGAKDRSLFSDSNWGFGG